MSKHSPKFERKTIPKPSPDDLINVRYVLPGIILAKTEHGVEIRTCKGGIISVPKSLVSTTELPSNQMAARGLKSWTGEGVRSVVLEARVRRDVGRLLGSLISEVARLTGEHRHLSRRDAGFKATSETAASV
jgi:hypothetical protein